MEEPNPSRLHRCGFRKELAMKTKAFILASIALFSLGVSA